MSEQGWEGVALASVGLLALAIGFARGEMPINFRVNTHRDTNPAGFWLLAAFFGFIALAGLGIAVRFG